ncbi:MAG TPA: tetratricopeptide repeat protein [Pyrinomonadaceae bacterium]
MELAEMGSVRWEDVDDVEGVARLVALQDPEGGRLLEECWPEVMSLEDMGLYGEAAYECRKMLEVSERPQVYRLVALEHVVCAERARAVLLGRECVDDDPSDPDRHRVLGDVHFDLECYGDAARAYQRAVELGAGDAGLLLSLGLCHALLGDYGRAAVWHGRALAADPESEDSLHEISWAYHRLGCSSKAIAVLERSLALEADPGCAECRGRLAATYRAHGRHAEAEAADRQPARPWGRRRSEQKVTAGRGRVP